MKFLNPSRPDAEVLTSGEKAEMLFFVNAVSLIHDANDRLKNRIAMVENGPERIKRIADESYQLLEDIRVTIPEKQRRNLRNISMDMEIRMVPKMSPKHSNVIMTEDNFRELVNAARAKCKECTLDEDECQTLCDLFELLAAILPISEYKSGFLCPYNLANWGDGDGK